MLIEPAHRLTQLPPYVFSEVNKLTVQAEKRGVRLLSLAIGDPDLPTPQPIIDRIREATTRTENHGYSPYEGTQAFRHAVASYFIKRFHVELNPKTEVVALIGSKEGVAHFPFAFCNPGDCCLYPDPGYPIFLSSILLAGGVPKPVTLRAENQFIPELNELEDLFVQNKPKYLLLNFPSNPTTAVCPKGRLKEMVFLAKKYGVILVHDSAYSEIYFDPASRPASILEIEGAKDVAIEFHSLSKTFSMTGWRIGFAVGNPQLIAGLLRLKTNIDSGPLLAVQEASVFAFSQFEELCGPIRETYAKRRKLALDRLTQLHLEYFMPQATFYVWVKVPGQKSSMEFAKTLIEKQGVVVTPGIGFGQAGEHFFRLSLTVPEAQIEQAMDKIGKAIT
ncbi:MAG: aminotransferase class I/II-fold pyridoxal phosphate-dependent enzyme [Deltaproteobacteria bacterium]|nr:aminotransferase class I/II-fold pyridoxal phosphate-dependent enzyme [Deltaproteobacteria bacterium]